MVRIDGLRPEHGTIKWQVPLGDVQVARAKGVKNTGSYHPTRNGLVVTAGGLIFIGTWSDRTLRAYDKETGKVLWEKELDANPEGIPAVYEVGGKQYIAFCTRAGRVFDNIGADSIAWSPGKPEAAGYYVFRLHHDASHLLHDTAAAIARTPYSRAIEWLADTFRELHIDAHFAKCPRPYADFDAERAAATSLERRLPDGQHFRGLQSRLVLLPH